ncbi:MAG: hypothetical protein N2037_06345 [Acidimicrobiales bacterium]|nr:hypothetical protein [Acidimicrobiales bacterium]
MVVRVLLARVGSGGSFEVSEVVWVGVHVKPERIFAWYFGLQAVAGILLWVGLAWVGDGEFRHSFDLVAGMPEVTDSFVFADLFAGVLGSAASAWAVSRRRPWAPFAAAFTAGAMVYPTLFLVGWVTFVQTGAVALAVMVPAATLSCWLAYHVWRSSR